MSLREVARLKLHRDRITALAAGSCSCESLLLSGSDDSTVALWDTRDNKSTGVIGGFDLGEDDGGITGIGFASDFSLVVSYGAHVSVLDRRKISRYSQRSAVALADFDHGCDVEALSTRGDFVALVDEEGMVGVFDVTDSSISVDKFAGAHDALASCVTIHPEQPEIATGGFDQKVRFWDMAEETQINEVDANVVSNRTSSQKQLVNPPFVYALDYWNIDADASTRMLASGHADGGIMCIDGDSARFWPECHGYSISALQFVRSRPDLLVTAGLDRVIKLWSAESLFVPEASLGDGASRRSIPANDDMQPQMLFSINLSAKPDTVATSETCPRIYTDNHSDVVAYAIV